MRFHLSERSEQNLEGVHEHLVKVVNLAIKITVVDFAVIEGVRSLEKQKEYFAAGKSKTMKSRHLTGHAVDLAAYIGGKICWEPWSLYEDIAEAMFKAAHMCNTVIEWGGHFGTFQNYRYRAFRDGPHFQLPRKLYHASEIA